MKYFYKRIVLFSCMITTPLLLVAQQGAGQYGPNMMWGGWQGMLFAPVFMIIFTVLIILGVVFLVRWLGGSSDGGGSKTSAEREPLDILKERFAGGDIDRDEYIARRQLLEEK